MVNLIKMHKDKNLHDLNYLIKKKKYHNLMARETERGLSAQIGSRLCCELYHATLQWWLVLNSRGTSTKCQSMKIFLFFFLVSVIITIIVGLNFG